MLDSRIMKRYLPIALIALMVISAFAVMIYHLPYGESAGAYDVSVSVDNASKEVAAGSTITFQITIKNEGTNADRYNLNMTVAKSPSTWQHTLSQTSTGQISSGATLTGIIVQVRAPSTGVDISSYCYVTIKVTSQTDAKNSTASVLLTALIKRSYGVSISDPGIKRMNPGGSVVYSFNVKNEGNDQDGYQLEAVTVPTGFSASVNFDTGKFAAGSTKAATMTVQSPTTARSGSYQVVVKATSVTDSTIIATRTVTATVNQTYKLSISSDGVKEVDITKTRVVNFPVRIQNLGNGEDQFTLSYYIPPSFVAAGWGGDISTTTTAKVAADGSFNATFYAYVPTKSNNPAVNSKGEFFINASSVGDPAVKRFVKVSCVVLPYYDVSIANTGPSSKSVDPSGTVTFSFTVKNIGNDQDSITMNLAYPDGFQDSSVEPSTVSLAAQASTTITLTINPDDTIVKAKSYRFVLYANSTHGPSANSVFFVTINKNYGAYLDAPNGASIASGQPGQTYKILVRVQNKGNGVDTFDLSVSGETSKISAEWSPLISSAVTPQLQSDGWFSFNVTVTAPANATMGTYRFKVDAESNGGSIIKSFWLSVRIPQLYNVDISANKESLKGEYSNITGSPRVVTYLLDVYNKGSGTDSSISISVKTAPTVFAGKYSIYFTENTKAKISIGEKASKQARLNIEMPTTSSGILAGTYSFVVQVSSDNGTLITTDDKYAQITLSLILQPTHAVKILTGVNSTQVRIGKNVTFQVIVQNRGTVDDYYQLSYSYPNYGQYVKFSIPNANLTTRTLKPLEQETIILTATILTGANPNWRSVWVKVDATHPSDFTVKDERYFTAIFADDFSGDLATTDDFEQARPGYKGWFNLTLKNTGTRATDTFVIALEGTSPFENIEIKPSTVTIASNARVTVSINVSIPTIEDKIVESGTYEMVFKATSKGETSQDSDDIIVDKVTLKLKVMPVYKVQILIPQGSMNSDVGKTLPAIKINVTNKGNEPSTIQVSVASITPTGIRSWVTIAPSTVSDVAPQKGTDVIATIKVPSTAIAGKQTFTFQADVVGQSVPVTATFEVVVNDFFKPELTVPDGSNLKTADPGDTKEFTLKLTNKGNTQDSFDLTLNTASTVAKIEWAKFGFKSTTGGKTTETTLMDLGKDLSRDIWLNVTLPDNAPAGDAKYTVTATSKGDDTIEAQYTVTVSIDPNRDVEVISNEETKEVTPNVDKDYTELTYSIQVVNLGEDDDSFKVQVVDTLTAHPHKTATEWADVPKSDHPTDVVLSKVKTATIPKGGQETLTVTVRVQKSYYTPGSFNTVIWAYSEGESGTADDKYSEPLILVTKIKQAYGADLSVTKDKVSTIFSSDGTKLVATFTVKVENTGTGIDNYKIETKSTLSTNDFKIDTDVDTVTQVAKGATAPVIVTVEMDPDTTKGSYSFDVRWISRGDDVEYLTTEDYVTSWKTLTFDIIQTYGVSVDTPSEEKEVEVGSSAEFKLTIKNLGNTDDNFKVEVKNDKGLNWATLSKSRFTLGGKGTQTQETEVSMKVNVPKTVKDAKAGDYFFTVNVTRDSTSGEKVYDSLLLKVTVNELFDFTIDSDDSSYEVDPGETTTFQFDINNEGNAEDTYTISVKGDRKEWATLSVSTITIPVDGYRSVTLTVAVPSLDTAGSDLAKIEARNYDFNVVVESNGDKERLPEEITFTADVQQKYGVDASPEEAATKEVAKDHDVNGNDPLTVKFNVENLGNGEDSMVIQKPSTVPIGWIVEVSSSKVVVPLGEEKTVTITIRFSADQNFAAGLKELKFTVIPDDGSATGKLVKKQFSVWINAKAPDLVLDDNSLSQIPAASKITVGSDNTIRVTVKNIGTAVANDVTVRLLDNDNEVESVTKDVGINQEQIFEFKWNPKAGSHTLKVVVNDGSAVIESNEGNNEAVVVRDLSMLNFTSGILVWILLAFVVILLILLAIVGFIARNKNREAKELAERIRGSDLGLDKGGPRKVIKETAGTPAMKGPAGLPGAAAAGAPAALGPAKDAPQKKEPVRVKCPECNTEQVFSITQRPAEVQCKNCGVLMRIPEKKR